MIFERLGCEIIQINLPRLASNQQKFRRKLLAKVNDLRTLFSLKCQILLFLLHLVIVHDDQVILHGARNQIFAKRGQAGYRLFVSLGLGPHNLLRFHVKVLDGPWNGSKCNDFGILLDDTHACYFSHVFENDLGAKVFEAQEFDVQAACVEDLELVVSLLLDFRLISLLFDRILAKYTEIGSNRVFLLYLTKIVVALTLAGFPEVDFHIWTRS